MQRRQPTSQCVLIVCLSALLSSSGTAWAVTAEEIEASEFAGQALAEERDPLVVKLQVLLDRNNASPGVIDGYRGENLAKAIAAFEKMKGLEADGAMDEEVWAALARGGEPITTSYTITTDDLSGLVDRIPEDYSEMAKMDHVGYTSVEEKLAERFHMDVDFLMALNAEVDFSVSGTEIVVTDPGRDAAAKVASIEVDKQQAQLRAFDASGKLVTAYPVTVGSTQFPSPSGRHEIVAIALEATYSYQPDENFTQGDNDTPLTLPPGPNNPVGGIWIDLSKPTYGLHGTSEPEEIDKTPSHGCVRLTNWDARELAEIVSKGVPVEFVDQ